MEQGESPAPEYRRGWTRFLQRTEIPLAVYCTIFVTMGMLWLFQDLHPDITMGFFTELLGAAFTLFIIDTLLVRSKVKRWQLVQEHLDYLIARDVNRLRDGLAVRVFGFDPEIAPSGSEGQLEAVREQRARFLTEMAARTPEGIASSLSTAGLFTDTTFAWFDEKANDLWDIFNMRYSEYMDPDLVAMLLRLHTHLKDIGAHIRQYARAETFPDDALYYQTIGVRGASVTIREILVIVNELKRQGYSRPASLEAA